MPNKKDKLRVFIGEVRRDFEVSSRNIHVKFAVTAYNRGHAAKLIAKRLESDFDIKLLKSDTIEELDLHKEQVLVFNVV